MKNSHAFAVTRVRDPEGSASSTTPLLELEHRLEKLMSRLRVAVIFAGDKRQPGSVLHATQNLRSWKSYEAVAGDIAGALQRIGFRHVELIPEDMRLAERLQRAGTHMAWLNTGGVQGQNSAAHACAMLEMIGVPYVGHDPLAATTLDNKHAFKREALCAGLPTAPFSTWHGSRGPFRPDCNARFVTAFGAYPGPFVVKPVSGRASLHVHFVQSRAELAEAVAEVYKATGNTALVERYLPGREFCIAVAGPVRALNGRLVDGGGPFAFGALERTLEPGEKIFTSMDDRPITQSRFRRLDPTWDGALLTVMRNLARDVFDEFGLHAIVRLDIRADEQGNLFVLEANPKPDLKHASGSTTSLISAGLSECGMSYDELILSLIADRLNDLFAHHGEAAGPILELIGEQPARTQTLAKRIAPAPEAARLAESQAASAGGGPAGGSAFDEFASALQSLVVDLNAKAVSVKQS